MPRIRNKITGEIVDIPDQGLQRVGPASPATQKLPGEIEGQGLSNALARQKLGQTGMETQKTAQDLRKGGGLSEQDQNFINAIRTQVGGIDDTISTLSNAAQITDRMNPDVARYAEWGTVGEGGGLGDWLGSKLFGGLTTPQQKDDFQTLSALQNEAVLLKQQAQKGPQTEADAIRMQLSSLSPFKRNVPNAAIIGQAALNARLAQRRPGFYTEWAQKHGSVNEVDQQGRSVDQAWKKFSDVARSSFEKNPAIKRIKGARPKDDGWKIEEAK